MGTEVDATGPEPQGSRHISRRTLIAGAGAAIGAGVVIAACGDDDGGDSATPGTGAATTTPTSSGDTTATTTADTGAGGDVKKGGTLRLGIVGSTNDIIDGQYIVTKADQARLVLGWEPLVAYDADFNLSYEHALAKDIEAVAPDHYIIHLKEGVTFHDGKPMTSADVLYSFGRRLDPSSEVYSAGLAGFVEPAGITAVDDLTVDIKLLKPAVTFLNTMAEYTMTVVPEGYTRQSDPQIGTGPFVLKSFTPGAESVHERNPNYWGGADIPYLDEVQVIDFADATAMINALKSGEVDAIADVPFSVADSVEGDGLKLLVSEAGSWLTITMAIDQAPMDDPKVRQAMRLIVDRDEMVNRVIAGYGSVANDLYGKLDACYNTDIPQRTQDIEKAKQLLDEAGQAGMTIDLFAPDDTAGLPEMIAVFAEQAQKAGITVNAQVLDGGTYWGDEYTKRTFATSFWGTRPYLVQVGAGSLRTATYPETHWPPDGSDFEDLYNEALATVDQDARCEIIHQMQQEEWDNGGFIIPFFNNLVDAYADYVVGFIPQKNVLNLDHFGRGMKQIWLNT